MTRKKLIRIPDFDKGSTRIAALKSIDLLPRNLDNRMMIAKYE